MELLTKFGNGTSSKTISMKYIIVDAPIAAYDIILGRPSLNELGAIVSTPYLTMKFHSSSGEVVSVRADQEIARQCYVGSLKISHRRGEKAEVKGENIWK